MFRLVGQALSALLLIAVALVALLWQWAAENPLLASVLIPSVVCGFWSLHSHGRKLQQAEMDARLRDEHVPSMSPREYEQFVARQLERAGWSVKHCGRNGDQGADVVAEIRGFKCVVQCKLYRVRCGNDAVQQVAAARRHYGAQLMAVVAPAGFTQSAQALAASNGVHLLHHSQLATLEGAARIP